MKKILLVLLIMVGFSFSLFVSKDAEAGQICWAMEPFIDIVKVSSTVPDPLRPAYKLLNGVWADFSNVWPVVGSMVVNPYSNTEWVITLHGTRNDNTVWDLRGVVNKTTKSGTWAIKNPEDSFTNNGTFTKIPCSTPFPGVTAGLMEEEGVSAATESQ
jgi:hypothetical protein